jgi:hypothetical protein
VDRPAFHWQQSYAFSRITSRGHQTDRAMKDKLHYKDFIGSVHFSEEDAVFYGKIEGINDLVSLRDRQSRRSGKPSERQ